MMTKEFKETYNRIVTSYQCVNAASMPSSCNDLSNSNSLVIYVGCGRFKCVTVDDLNEVELFCKSIENIK